MKKDIRIIVTGTDTGVGKTFFCILIGKILQKNKVDFSIYKPFATGAVKIKRKLEIEDLYLYKKELDLKINKNLFVSKTFNFPNAPTVASIMDKKRLSENDFVSAWKLYKTIAGKFRNIIIEGIGGLLAPVTFNKLFIDFVKILKLPVILITTNKLGTINHTLLSIKLLQNMAISFSVVFNEIDKTKSKRENQAILDDIKRFSKIRNVFILPFLKKI